MCEVAEGAPLPRWKFFSAERLTDAQVRVRVRVRARVSVRVRVRDRVRVLTLTLPDAQLDRALLCRADHVLRHAWDAPGAYPVSRPLPQAMRGELVRVRVGMNPNPNPDPDPNPNPNPNQVQGERGFVLDESDRGAVLHPSAIETATSAMEVVALAGANAARLVVAHINGRA